MKKFLNFDRVLCLSPHPDDVEYSMSGAMHECPNTKFHILNLSNGTAQDPTSGPERIKEAQEFWKILHSPNVSMTHMWDSETFKQTETEVVSFIEHRFGGQFDAVCGPTEIDSHPEHQFVNNLMPALGRHKPISILEYKTSSTLPGWQANFHVEISEETVMKKIYTLPEAFKSQSDGNYFQPRMLQAFHQDFYQMKRGIPYCESFRIQVMYDK